MPLRRFNIQLAIPIAIWNTIPIDKKIEVRDAIRYLQNNSVIINEGTLSEEFTNIAEWHLCYHEDNYGKPPEEHVICLPWEKI